MAERNVIVCKPCQHEHFAANANVIRLMDVGQFRAEVTIKCVACGIPFRFVGLPCGLLNSGAATNVDGTELNVPIAPGPSQTLPVAMRYEVTRKGTEH